METTNTNLVYQAIRTLAPTSEFSIEEYDTSCDILWLSPDVIQPTEVEITAEVSRLQAEYDANAYARSRKTAYDALNQLELISDDAINGTTTHADAILAIKAEFPKPV